MAGRGPRKRREGRLEQYESPTYLDLVERLATNVERLRANRGWTQEQSAHACEMTTRLYQRVEGAESNFTATTLARLSDGFSVDPRILLAPIKKKRRSG